MYDVFLLDPDLFLKNYFHTLLNKVPDRLFNFNTWPSLSIIPIFQYIGIIPVIGGLLYLQKIKINKLTISILSVTSIFTIFFISIFGEFHTHFFAIITVPLLAISILNLKHFKKEFLATSISTNNFSNCTFYWCHFKEHINYFQCGFHSLFLI